MSHQPLVDNVAVVAGATRGAGRGIARMLGAAGATVYCTGRSVRGGQPVTPGFLRSEAVLDAFGVTAANWRDAIETDPYFAESETPCFVGRAVAALAADPHVSKKSGGLFSSWALAKEYGFTDLDGRRPDWSTAESRCYGVQER